MSNQREEPTPSGQSTPETSLERSGEEPSAEQVSDDSVLDDSVSDGDESRADDPQVDPGEVTSTPDDREAHEGSTLEGPIEEPYVLVERQAVQRRPKFGQFAFIGGLIGLVGALILAQLGSIDPAQNYTRVDLSIVVVGLGVPLAILISLIVALLLDRDRRRR